MEQYTNDRPVIYVAGPLLSTGSVFDNVHAACHAGGLLIEFGFAPIVPHALAFQQFICPIEGEHLNYDLWMSVDLSIVSKCDGVLRLPGDSKGADIETDFCEDIGIPVFDDLWEMCDHFKVGEDG